MGWFNKNADDYNQQGNELRDLGKYQDAIKSYDKAIELDPNNAVYHNNKGNALYSLSKYRDAIKAYDKAIELDPNNAVYHDSKGCTLYSLGEYRDAIEPYNKAIELDPNNAVYHDNKGSALYNLGLYQDSIELYDKAIELDPSKAVYHNNKGRALYSLGEYRDAIEPYNKAIELDPNNAVYRNNKIEVLYKLGKHQEALEGCDKVINSAKGLDILPLLNNKICPIEKVDLYDQNIGDEGVKKIVHVLKNNKLVKELDLGSNNIGSDGAKALFDLLQNNNVLLSLNLHKNNIGIDDMLLIADALKANTNSGLSYLNLKENAPEFNDIFSYSIPKHPYTQRVFYVSQMEKFIATIESNDALTLVGLDRHEYSALRSTFINLVTIITLPVMLPVYLVGAITKDIIGESDSGNGDNAEYQDPGCSGDDCISERDNQLRTKYYVALNRVKKHGELNLLKKKLNADKSLQDAYSLLNSHSEIDVASGMETFVYGMRLIEQIKVRDLNYSHVYEQKLKDMSSITSEKFNNTGTILSKKNECKQAVINFEAAARLAELRNESDLNFYLMNLNNINCKNKEFEVTTSLANSNNVNYNNQDLATTDSHPWIIPFTTAGIIGIVTFGLYCARELYNSWQNCSKEIDTLRETITLLQNRLDNIEHKVDGLGQEHKEVDSLGQEVDSLGQVIEYN